ncbi:MAG: tandem-95 repeat protein [Deltaproteobacteria bacterium]|nr:tandem-95 repeat protein [Deltaproteobacteria bacterium]
MAYLLLPLAVALSLLASGAAPAERGTPAANAPPEIADVTLDATEDASATINLKATDPDGNTVTFRLLKGPKNGEASLTSSGQLIYTPKPDFHGDDALTFEVTDGKAKVARQARVSVSSVNDRPVAAPVELKGAEDKRVAGQVKGRDVDGDPLTFAVGKAPARGAAEVEAATGRFTFTPDADHHGTVTFMLRMSDGTVDVDVPVTVTLEPVNDPPTTADDEESTREDVPLSAKLTAQDPDKDAVTFSVAARPAHGSVEIDAVKGSYVYTPARDFAGPDSFGFAVSDGKLSAKGRISLNVLNVNDPPSVGALTLEGFEEKPMSGRVVAKDADGDAITFKIASDAKHGDAEVDTDSGLVSYTPAADFNGVDSFVVEASDLAGGVPAVVKVTVKPVNDAPEAGDDVAKGDEDQPIVGRLRGTDVDQDKLRFTLTKGPRSGKAEVEGDGSFRYQANADFHGEDGFSFEVTDGSAKAAGTMQLQVKPVNDAPKTGDVAVAGAEDSGVKGRVVGSDIDKDALEYVVAKQGSKGTATIDEASGTFLYTPNVNEHGSDQFTVQVGDGHAKAEAVVRVAVAPVNDAPVAQAAEAGGEEDHPMQGDVVASDVDGDALTFRVLTPPKRGALDLDARAGTWRFTPRADENGADGFRFEASDGKLRAAADVKLTLAAVNDAPVVGDVALSTSEEHAVSASVPANDVDRDKLTWSQGLPPKKGTLAVDAATGRISYTPNLNENGEDSCVVEVADGVTKSSAKVTITIAAVNDAPVAAAGMANGVEDNPVRGVLVATDVDKDALTFKLAAPARLGAVQIEPAGTWSYTPRADENGQDAFRFEVTDGALKHVAEVKLAIAAVNDAPKAPDVTLTTAEDKDAAGKISAGDVDKDVLSYRVQAAGKLGTVSIDDATGAFRYAPLRDRSGLDRFTIAVTDGLIVSEAGVTVEVTPAPDAPVVDPRAVETAEDEPVSVELRAVDADGEPTTFTIVTPSALGAVELGPDGRTLRFTPAADVHGEDRMVVEAQDGKHRVRATLPVRVAAKNDAPTLDAASAQTPEETAVLVALVSHDKDGDAVQLALGGKSATGVTLDGHLLRVAPPLDFVGVLNVVVTPSDATGPGAALTVPITVVNVNDPPVLKDLVLKVEPGKGAVGALQATDADAGDELTYSLAVPARLGTVTLDDPRAGKFSYAANAGAKGEDSFRIRVRDKAGAGATATVRVTLAAPPAPAPPATGAPPPARPR